MRLSSIIGHDALRPKLSLLADQPGTYLFHGPPGCGKRTVAFDLSKYCLCVEDGQDGCNCRSCKIFGENHPDFLCIGQNNKILVGDVDKVLEFSYRAPFISSHRVIVVDNVERISIEGANRLLKVLEESSYMFFLTTSDIRQVIPTVVSRCFKIRFESLSAEDRANILWKKMGFELPKARILGWVGAGMSVDIFSRAGLYLENRGNVLDFLPRLFSKDLLGALDYVDRITHIDVFVDMLILLLTDILILKQGIEDILNNDLRDTLEKLSLDINDKALLTAVNMLSQVKKYAWVNVNLQNHFKTVLLKIHPILRVPA